VARSRAGSCCNAMVRNSAYEKKYLYRTDTNRLICSVFQAFSFFGNGLRLRNTQTVVSVPPNNSDVKIFLEIHPECKLRIM